MRVRLVGSNLARRTSSAALTSGRAKTAKELRKERKVKMSQELNAIKVTDKAAYYGPNSPAQPLHHRLALAAPHLDNLCLAPQA